MLTIKQKLSTGYEIVFEATRVNYQPENAEKGDKETLFVELPCGNASHTFLSGTYFVMNEAGSTVARYDLGPEPQH